MANVFVPVICYGELSCGDDGIEFSDQTGIFSLEVPLGYNAPSIVVPTLDVDTGVFGYESYGLEMWFAQTGGIDSTATPDFTLDLLTATHTTDTATGYVTWDLSLDTLGLSSIMSGWWLARVTGVWIDSDDVTHTYTATAQMFLTQDITRKVNGKMLLGDPDCSCKDGCISADILFMKLEMAEKDACLTYVEAAQANVDWLYYNWTLCTC